MSMKVRDSFSLNPVGNTSKYTDFINYIDTSSVNAGLLSEVSFLEDEFPSRAQRLVRPGDILYSSVICVIIIFIMTAMSMPLRRPALCCFETTQAITRGLPSTIYQQMRS